VAAATAQAGIAVAAAAVKPVVGAVASAVAGSGAAATGAGAAAAESGAAAVAVESGAAVGAGTAVESSAAIAVEGTASAGAAASFGAVLVAVPVLFYLITSAIEAHKQRVNSQLDLRITLDNARAYIASRLRGSDTLYVQSGVGTVTLPGAGLSSAEAEALSYEWVADIYRRIGVDAIGDYRWRLDKDAQAAALRAALPATAARWIGEPAGGVVTRPDGMQVAIGLPQPQGLLAFSPALGYRSAPVVDPTAPAPTEAMAARIDAAELTSPVAPAATITIEAAEPRVPVAVAVSTAPEPRTSRTPYAPRVRVSNL